MKKIGLSLILLAACLVLGSFGQADAVFEHKLPQGWKYKSFAISRSGLKALYLFPDLPGETLLTAKFQPRLQVFDKDDRLLHDCLLDHEWWLGSFTRNDNIIIYRGDETGCGEVKVVDPEGKVVSTADAGGRWPSPALLGAEIALVPGFLQYEKGGDEHRMRRCHLLPGQTDFIRSDGKHARPEEHGKYVIKDFGDSVRVEKCVYVDDPGPEKK